MALKSTIHKAHLQIADLVRHYYHDHPLTIARHPSETEKRMMLRVLAFALYAHEDLQFTKGLCADDEPDLWQINPNQTLACWIELGVPDLKRLKKAASRAEQAVLLCYGDNAVAIWWQQMKTQVKHLANLTVLHINDQDAEALSLLSQRSMQLSVTIQEDSILVSDETRSIELQLERLQ